jgi:hypothetical protein
VRLCGLLHCAVAPVPHQHRDGSQHCCIPTAVAPGHTMLVVGLPQLGLVVWSCQVGHSALSAGCCPPPVWLCTPRAGLYSACGTALRGGRASPQHTLVRWHSSHAGASPTTWRLPDTACVCNSNPLYGVLARLQGWPGPYPVHTGTPAVYTAALIST